LVATEHQFQGNQLYDSFKLTAIGQSGHSSMVNVCTVHSPMHGLSTWNQLHTIFSSQWIILTATMPQHHLYKC